MAQRQARSVRVRQPAARGGVQAKSRRFPIIEVGLIVIALVSAVAFPSPVVIERGYSNGLYPGIDSFVRAFTGGLPFCVGDVLFLFALVALVGTVVRAIGTPAIFPITMLRVAAAFAFIFLWFMWSWGYNYRREPLESRLVVHRERTSDDVVALGNRAVREMNAASTAAHQEILTGPTDFDNQLEPSFLEVLKRLGNVAGEPRPTLKPTLFNGFMQATATYGFTDPWTHEVSLVSTLFPYERPASYAHEWSHIAGFADESEANYIAAVSCIRSKDPLTRYSGWILVWFNLPPDLKVTEHADLQVYDDIQAIKHRYNKEVRPDVAHVSNSVYNSYLKANNVKAGMQSYHLFVRLLAGGEFDSSGLPLLRADPNARQHRAQAPLDPHRAGAV
jgi:hypothetical protein